MSATKTINNSDLARKVQAYLRTEGYDIAVDGWAGDKTMTALKDYAEILRSVAERPALKPLWPRDTQEALVSFYGPPGRSQQVYIDPPYPMVAAWDTSLKIRRISCHFLVAKSLQKCLSELLLEFGSSGIAYYGLNLFGGVYRVRTVFGADRWSTHAFGAAIDLNPEENGPERKWPDDSTMPLRAVEVFEKNGWTSLGRTTGKDAMHMEATSLRNQ